MRRFISPARTLFTKNGEYYKFDSSGIVIVGISNDVQKRLGDIVFVDLPDVNCKIDPNQQIMAVDSVDAANDIRIPFSGTICEINKTLEDDPSIVNKDPQGSGWFIKFIPDNIEDIQNDINLIDEQI